MRQIGLKWPCIYAIDKMTIRANNRARGNHVFARLLLIIEINSRGKLGGRKGAIATEGDAKGTIHQDLRFIKDF